jgi:hypothetical protein
MYIHTNTPIHIHYAIHTHTYANTHTYRHAHIYTVPLEPTRPSTCPGRGTGILCSLNVLGPVFICVGSHLFGLRVQGFRVQGLGFRV